MASVASDIIIGALLNINSYSPGESLSATDGQVGLDALNDLVASLNNDEAWVFTQQETIFPWIAGQFQYTVGNPVGGKLVGTMTGGTPYIIGIVNMPANIILGGTLTDSSSVI